MITKELKEKIDNLSYDDQDDIYRYLWSKHVAQDVKNHATNLDIELDDDEIDIITEHYCYWGDYDCNLDYWTNIENLIMECIKSQDKKAMVTIVNN